MNRSPSISISRRMGFSSLVDMRFLPRIVEKSADASVFPASRTARGDHVIDDPLSLLLPKCSAAQHASGFEHFVRWQQNSL